MSIVTELKYTANLDKGVCMTPITPSFMGGDQEAHRITVDCYRQHSREAVDLSDAGVTAYFVRADGMTIPLTGETNGSKASVLLPAACYEVMGRFSLVVKLSLDDGTADSISTVFWGEGAVSRSRTDVVIDPDSVIPSLEELLAQIEAMEIATNNANTAASNANQAAAQAVEIATAKGNEALQNVADAVTAQNETISQLSEEIGAIANRQEHNVQLAFTKTDKYIASDGEHDFAYTYQAFVDVVEGDMLKIHGINYGTVPSCVALNSDGTFHSYVQNSNSYDEYEKDVTVASGVAQIVFQTNSSRIDKYSLVIITSKEMLLNDKIVPEAALTNALRVKIFPLWGKSAVFAGDSICNGASAKDGKSGWAGRIGTANEMNWVNRGISGATITKAVTGSSGVISDTDFEIDGKAPDYIIFEGGTNDADLIGDARTTPPERFGAIAEGVAGYADYSFDQSTFCGAFEYMIYRIVNNYPKAKVGYIVAQKMTMTNTSTPDYTPQNNNRRLYFEKAIEICRKWGVPVLNLWDDCNINPRIPSHYTYGETGQQQIDAKRFYVDGQHLTEYGYDYITPKIEAWMRTL